MKVINWDERKLIEENIYNHIYELNKNNPCLDDFNFIIDNRKVIIMLRDVEREAENLVLFKELAENDKEEYIKAIYEDREKNERVLYLLSKNMRLGASGFNTYDSYTIYVVDNQFYEIWVQWENTTNTQITLSYITDYSYSYKSGSIKINPIELERD